MRISRLMISIALAAAALAGLAPAVLAECMFSDEVPDRHLDVGFAFIATVVEASDAPIADKPSEILATTQDGENVIGILNDLLSESGLQVSAEVAGLRGKYINLSLGGRDVSYLVGRRGEVLNAVQYLINVIVARQLESGVRVVIDGDNFRRRREEVLEKLAHDIATEVQKRGEEAVLDALPAFERRVIHQALQEFPGVVTYSEGEEPDRRVVIAPAEAP